jgi:hypothetical protein
MGRIEVHTVLLGKPERRRSLGISRHIRKDNIKMDLREVVWGVRTGSIWLRIGKGGMLL